MFSVMIAVDDGQVKRRGELHSYADITAMGSISHNSLTNFSVGSKILVPKECQHNSVNIN